MTDFLLSNSQRQEFSEKGYLVVAGLFNSAEISKMREAFERLEKTAKTFDAPVMHGGAYFVVDEKKIDRIVWCGAAEPDLLEVGSDSRLVGPASQLLNSTEMDQLLSQAHFKLPADGVGFGWHQDSEHRRYGTEMWQDANGKGSYVQTIMAIDAMTESNGPLMIVPASHLDGHLYLDKSNEDYSEKAITLQMKPGTVLFMSPYTIHGSFPNESKVPRRVFINGYAYPGANHRVYPGEGSGRRLKSN